MSEPCICLRYCASCRSNWSPDFEPDCVHPYTSGYGQLGSLIAERANDCALDIGFETCRSCKAKRDRKEGEKA